jgi:hypothetical protein
MLGLKPVAIVTFVKSPDEEPVDAAGEASGVASGVAVVVPGLVAAVEAADGVPATGVAPGVLLSEVVVSVDGSVADVDEPQAARIMLTQSITTTKIDLRMESLLAHRVRTSDGRIPAAEYHSSAGSQH